MAAWNHFIDGGTNAITTSTSLTCIIVASVQKLIMLSHCVMVLCVPTASIEVFHIRVIVVQFGSTWSRMLRLRCKHVLSDVCDFTVIGYATR